MDAKHWNGAPGECLTDPELWERREHVPLCEYHLCAKPLGREKVHVTGVGWCCSRDCADAAFGHYYRHRQACLDGDGDGRR